MQMINHQQAQEFLHMRRIDLSETETQALKAHLASCAECSHYAASLEDMEWKLRNAFHSRWDGVQPLKSQTGGTFIRLGREIMRMRISTIAGTVITVLALIALVLGLDLVLSNFRAQPAAEPTLSPEMTIAEQSISPGVDETPGTPPAEDIIVLNFSISVIPQDPEVIAYGENWAQRLSAASGLKVVAAPGPSTDLEILQGLREGKIHIAELDALAFVYGQEQGWIVPGAVVEYEYQPSGSIMFVARTDSGLMPGEPPEVFQQLAGKRPCWPDPAGAYQNNPPVKEYFLPAGLLVQAGVNLGKPVFNARSSTGHFEKEAVFLGECDFAVVEGESEETFLNTMNDYLMNRGVSFSQWKEQMQVLYTSAPLEPARIMAFSSTLEPAKRESLINALLSTPDKSSNIKWLPYDDEQADFYGEFLNLVQSSGVEVADYLNRVWDLWLRDIIAAAQTPTPASSPTNPPSSRTLTICQGAEPDTLYIYGGSMLAAQNILEAIYDGPIDKVGFSYQPVILEKLPSLADGDATIQPVAVKENDYVVNDSGEVVRLQTGEVVRPFGCYQSDCAITWQGEALEMAQMTARFTLVEGILWSDDKPLTAQDSVFSFETASGCKSPWESGQSCGTLGEGRILTMERTASYTALDDRTTQWVGLPGYLDQSYMTNFAPPLPEHQLRGLSADELHDAEESARKPLGWGAYSIERWKPGEQISFTRNPNYFRADEGLPYFDKLVIRFYGLDEAATVAALQNGECDLIDYEQAVKNVELASLVKLDKDGVIQALITTGTTWEHLDFNIRPTESMLNSGAFAGWDLDGDGQGPFGDVRLRKAIAMCLDRRTIVDDLFLTVDNLFMGQSMVPNTYLPPNHPLINTQAMVYHFHPSAATTLLDEAGWLDHDNDPATPRIATGVLGVPDGTPLLMNYETTTAEIRQQVFDILSQNLAECGIQVNLVTYSANDFFKSEPSGRITGRLYDLAEFAWLTGVNPPCSLFLASDIPSEENNWMGQNNTGFMSPEFDAACSLQLQSLPGGDGYMQGVMDAQRIFSEELPVVPLFMRVKYAAAREDMCGYSVDPTSQSDFWNIEAFNYGEGCR